MMSCHLVFEASPLAAEDRRMSSSLTYFSLLSRMKRLNRSGGQTNKLAESNIRFASARASASSNPNAWWSSKMK
jgi:hypothetical protein